MPTVHGSVVAFWVRVWAVESGELSSAINVLRNLKLDEDATVSVSLFPVFC